MTGNDFDTAEGVADAFDVSRESRQRLEIYVALLQRWNAAINLVSDARPEIIWRRHVADSLQLCRFVPSDQAIIDLGSGAGFPGLPLALMRNGPTPAVVHLVESNRKKAAFLVNAVRVTNAPAIVHPVRIESLVTLPAEILPKIVVARALAPLSGLLEMAEVFLKKGATAVFLKGRDVESELTEAAKSWRITAEIHSSLVDPSGRVVVVHQANHIGR